MTDTESDNENIKMPTRCLFKRELDVSPNDVINDMDIPYAITVNIQPTKLMNKRRWCNYSHDEQRKILLRIEEAFRRKTPIVKLQEIQFEVCPTLDNIHYHALYYMPKVYVNEMIVYFRRVCNSSDRNTIKEWRYIDIQELKSENDINNWIQYIRKQQQ